MENDSMTTTTREIKKGNPFLRFLTGLIFFILVAAASIGGTAYFINQKPEVLGLSKASQTSQAEVDKLVTAVSKLLELPMDEKPTVATVTDVEKVKDQVFFKNAKNEDKVLIYQKAQKAILYRPSENRVIEVGAVSAIQGTPTSSPSVSASATATPTAKSTATPVATPLAE